MNVKMEGESERERERERERETSIHDTMYNTNQWQYWTVMCLQVVFEKEYFQRTLPHTDIPHTVEYLHGGPQPPSKLQKRHNKVMFKVSLWNVAKYVNWLT